MGSIKIPAPAMPAEQHAPAADGPTVIDRATIEQIVDARMATLERKLDVQLHEMRAGIETVLSLKASRAEVDSAIKIALLPLHDQLNGMQTTLQTLATNLIAIKDVTARMGGMLDALMSARSSDIAAVSDRVERVETTLQLVEASQAGVVADVREARRDLYGAADTPAGPVSLFERIDSMAEDLRALRGETESHFRQQQQQLDALRTTVEQWRSAGKTVTNYAKQVFKLLAGSRVKQILLLLITLIVMALSAASGNREAGQHLIEMAQTAINLPTMSPIPTPTRSHRPTESPLPWLVAPSPRQVDRRTPVPPRPTSTPVFSFEDLENNGR